MKVLYIYDHKFIFWNNSYYSEGKFSNEIFSRYDALDAEIIVICRAIQIKNFNPNKYNKIDKENIKFVPVKGVGFFSIFTIYFLYNFILCSYLMIDSKFIIVRLPSILGLYLLTINLIFRKKYCTEVVGDGLESWLNSRKKNGLIYKKIAILLDFFRKKYIKNSLGVVYVTKRYLQSKYPTNGKKLVASNVNIFIKHRDIYIQNYELNKNEIKIGLIGSFNNHYKGIETAIKALKILNNDNIYLEIVGSGSLLEEYKTLCVSLDISSKVIFKGSIQGGKNIFEWLDGLDIYIQPSYTEGLPRALIEAMSIALPCIGTSVGGIPELLSEDFIIEPKCEFQLAEKISALIYDIDLRFIQGKLNYETSKSYDSKLLNDNRVNFWKSIKKAI